MAGHVGIIACSPPRAALCFEILSKGASALANSTDERLEISMHGHTLDPSQSWAVVEASDYE